MSGAPEGMIPVEEFAKLKGITASKAIDMVRDGLAGASAQKITVYN